MARAKARGKIIVSIGVRDRSRVRVGDKLKLGATYKGRNRVRTRV